MARPLALTLGHWAYAKLRDREEDFYLADPVGYERVVDLFDRRRRIAGIYAGLIDAHFRPGRARWILDQACGTGLLSERLARVADRVTGLDMSSSMLELARRKHIANAEFIEGDFHDLSSFEDGSIDAVTQFAASRYVSDPERYHGEIARVLSDDGIALISYYDAPGLVDKLLPAARRSGLEVLDEVRFPTTVFLSVAQVVGYRDRSVWILQAKK